VADKTKIEWADATWNPIRARSKVDGQAGWFCEHVSEGCRNCYAERMNTWRGTGVEFKPGNRKRVELFLDSKMLAQPLRWRRPRMVFVCSMSDLFADFVPDEWIDRVFSRMGDSRQHKFQVLTKRPKRMREYLARFKPDGQGWVTPNGGDGYESACPVAEKRWPLPNVWLGTSCEDQATADERIPHLLKTPAAIRFVSYEPALGPVDFTYITGGYAKWINALEGYWWSAECSPIFRNRTAKLDWMIAGGESGPGARPAHPGWFRKVRDDCSRAGVAFLMKQWGEWAPHKPVPGGDLGGDVRRGHVCTVHPTGQTEEQVFEATGGRNTIPGTRYMARVGKKAAGRLLDGKTHDGFPA
jgi:protein gp37